MNKTIAIFPGAFRPPHKAHYAAIKELSEREDVSHSIIVISGRHRKIPNTLDSLGPDCTKKIWDIYCKSLDNVSVEIANSSAVDHSISFLNNVSPDDKLLFCLGQADFDNNDNRFLKLMNGRLRANRKYSITVAKTGQFSIRATQLRKLIAQGEQGKPKFIKSLPDYLTMTNRDLIWKICQQSRQNHSRVIANRILRLIETQRLGIVKKIKPINPKSNNPVFNVLMKNGQCWIVKEANDTEKSAISTDSTGIKSRKRLSVERRSIRLLNRIKPAQFELPKVVYFNKSQKILIQTMLYPYAKSLDSMLKEDRCNPNIAFRLGQILASTHNLSTSKPLWGSDNADFQQWQRVLHSRTKGLINPKLSSEDNISLDEMYFLSLGHTSKRFVFLNIKPEHIRLSSNRIGIVNLESSTSVGDPAFDLGIFIGRCLAISALNKDPQNMVKALKLLFKGYISGTKHGRLLSFQCRVAKFIGLGLVHSCKNSSMTLRVDRKFIMCARLFLRYQDESNDDLDDLLDKFVLLCVHLDRY